MKGPEPEATEADGDVKFRRRADKPLPPEDDQEEPPGSPHR